MKKRCKTCKCVIPAKITRVPHEVKYINGVRTQLCREEIVFSHECKPFRKNIRPLVDNSYLDHL